MEKDNMKEHWSMDPMLETPFFRKIMPRERFLNLLRCLHFENNDNAPDKTTSDYDGLRKLRSVFNPLSNEEALDLLQNLLSGINDVLTDDYSDKEVPANYLLEFSLDSWDNDQETELKVQ
ncbi:hypothetical protein TNCV_4143891 [Trichonephila clavipes]|nr:hypothetical protein TNCV_4143891 [Trichonephila clavipes]